MSYTALEESVQGGRPFELYKFVIDAEVFCYAHSTDEVTFNGELYKPTQINRSAPDITSELSKMAMEVNVPRDNEIAARFIPGSPNPVSLTVFRGHHGDPEIATVWKGKVSDCEHQGEEATMTCEPIYAAMRRNGIQDLYQLQCRRTLYGPGCDLDREQHKDVVTVLTVILAGSKLTFVGGSLTNGWYTGGELVRGPERRMITAHNSNTLDLISPLFNLKVGDTITIYQGCDREFATCRDKFENSDNHGGFPYMPEKNPFGNDGFT